MASIIFILVVLGAMTWWDQEAKRNLIEKELAKVTKSLSSLPRPKAKSDFLSLSHLPSGDSPAAKEKRTKWLRVYMEARRSLEKIWELDQGNKAIGKRLYRRCSTRTVEKQEASSETALAGPDFCGGHRQYLRR